MRSGVKGAPESDLTSEGSDRVREWTNGQHEEEAEEKESLCTRSHPKVNCKMHKRRRRRRTRRLRRLPPPPQLLFQMITFGNTLSLSLSLSLSVSLERRALRGYYTFAKV